MGELQNGNGPSRRGYAERFAPRFSKNLPLSIPILARGFSRDRVSIPETQNIKQHEGEKLTGIMATIFLISQIEIEQLILLTSRHPDIKVQHLAPWIHNSFVGIDWSLH